MIVLLFLIVAGASAEPTRCFSGGTKIYEKTSSYAVSEVCLKDDVGQVKIQTNFQKNDTGIFAIMSSWRKWTVSEWHSCKPRKVNMGSISVIEIDSNFTIKTASYSCNKDCMITVDKEHATVLLQSTGLNHYELTGTTIKTGWFKSTATVPLDQTCEHIKIICGLKSLQFHACFKQHMACVRFLHRSILPGYIASSICQNIELILMCCLITFIFGILLILTKTYICYLLLPIFIPFAYMYGWIYNKSCKKCALCGLAYHPFTKCGQNCVCGALFDTTERMKIHRTAGLCPGYKSMRTARVLCKNKGSALFLSVALGFLTVSFLTPIASAKTMDSHEDESKLYNHMLENSEIDRPLSFKRCYYRSHLCQDLINFKKYYGLAKFVCTNQELMMTLILFPIIYLAMSTLIFSFKVTWQFMKSKGWLSRTRQDDEALYIEMRPPSAVTTRTVLKIKLQKASKLFWALLLAVMINSFITVDAAMLPTPKTLYDINELPDDFRQLHAQAGLLHIITYMNAIWTVIAAILVLSIMILLSKKQRKMLGLCAIYCEECDMYHGRKGLKYNGDFTNKCGVCTCGTVEDATGLTIHKLRLSCLIKYKLKWFKMLLVFILCVYITKDMALLTTAEEIKSCLKKTELTGNCTGPFLEPYGCNSRDPGKLGYTEITSLLKSQKVISSLDEPLIQSIPMDVSGAIKKMNGIHDFHQKLLLDFAFLQRHCDYYTKFSSDSGYSQVSWRSYTHVSIFDICKTSNSGTCKCLKASTACTKNDSLESAATEFYKDQDSIQHDHELFLSVFKLAFPGTAYAYILNQTVQEQYDVVKNYLNAIQNKFPNNLMLKSLLKVGNIIYTNLSKVNLSHEHSESIPEYVPVQHGVTRGRTTFTKHNKVLNQSDVRTDGRCVNPKDIVCISPRTKAYAPIYTWCEKGSTVYIPNLEGLKLYKSITGDTTTYCVGDRHCLIQPKMYDTQTAEDIFNNECLASQHMDDNDQYSLGQVRCNIISYGTCFVQPLNTTWPIAWCTGDFFFYASQGSVPEDAIDPSERCLGEQCHLMRFPINPKSLSNCTYYDPKVKINRVKENIHTDFESYKNALIRKIADDLIIHKFQKTSNLPYFNPTYKYITMSGVDTTEGIENAYIEFEIPAMTGTAIGYNILAENQIHVVDLIIYIKVAKTVAEYQWIYSTGPTIAINTQHSEKCTGRCPDLIESPKGWATFSKERTSNWGCEEFGCLAIDDGCVFGSCQDVIKPESDVYKKVGQERTTAEICISMSHETYCTEIESTTPIISSSIEAQFKTIDAPVMPNIVLIRDHKLYKGQINDIGSFGKYCGNIQKRNSTILGQADVKFDYLCHAAQRKDVVVRKCLENNYASCKLLDHEEHYVVDEMTSSVKLSDLGRLTGILKSKVYLGDFKYKSFSKEIDIDATIECVGCYNCLKGIDCKLNLHTTVEASCKVEAPCPTSLNRIVIKPNVEEYAINMKCQKELPGDNIIVKICNAALKTQIAVSKKAEQIELSTGEQSTYIHEEDLRCSTWICKIKDEGFAFLLKPITDWLGSFTRPVLIVLSTVVILFLIIYIMLPIFAKIRDRLKEIDKEYERESRASRKSK
uniref:Envelopment polyprotein n=1 Tax=Gamboa virus TaxID=35313 RepID=A0A125RZ41_9VIRU|nr:glycoprotein [Gamboa virus]